MLVDGWKSISSHLSWPTSPIHRSPFSRSNENRHGFRRPYAQICCMAFDMLANGLLCGIAYVDALSTSSRSSLPRRTLVFCALFGGSPPAPPSPVPAYRYPSGPNCNCPPLWFEFTGCAIFRMTVADDGSATFGLAET